MNCYICLENTDKMIKHDCNCHIYSHVECYENWINYNKRSNCMICKKSKNKEYETYITIFLLHIFNKIQPIFNYFIDSNQNLLGVFCFLFISFILTMTLIIPLYILTFFSFLINNCKKHKNYQVIDL